MKQHPSMVGAFPDMNEIEFDGLVTDIKEHGLREPIVLFEDMILDGWNRYRACKQLRIEPTTTVFKGPGSPLDYAVSMNVKRRHLDVKDLAFIAADLIPRYAAEAAARQKTGKATLASPDAKVDSGKAAHHVAQIVGVSQASVERALYVMDKAPELRADPAMITVNQMFQAAQIVDKEQKHEAAKRGMTREQRAEREEEIEQRGILADEKRGTRLIDEAMDIFTKLVNEKKCKDLEPALKDFRAGAGKLRALHAKKDKAA